MTARDTDNRRVAIQAAATLYAPAIDKGITIGAIIETARVFARYLDDGYAPGNRSNGEPEATAVPAASDGQGGDETPSGTTDGGDTVNSRQRANQ